MNSYSTDSVYFRMLRETLKSVKISVRIFYSVSISESSSEKHEEKISWFSITANVNRRLLLTQAGFELAPWSGRILYLVPLRLDCVCTATYLLIIINYIKPMKCSFYCCSTWHCVINTQAIFSWQRTMEIYLKSNHFPHLYLMNGSKNCYVR